MMSDLDPLSERSQSGVREELERKRREAGLIGWIALAALLALGLIAWSLG
jgi:hypothetical protein